MTTQTPASVATSAARPRPDFISIQLTAAGLVDAGGDAGVLSIRRQGMDYTFNGTKPVEVLTSQWRSLQRFRATTGDPLFQEYVAPAKPAATKPTASAAAIAQD